MLRQQTTLVEAAVFDEQGGQNAEQMATERSCWYRQRAKYQVAKRHKYASKLTAEYRGVCIRSSEREEHQNAENNVRVADGAHLQLGDIFAKEEGWEQVYAESCIKEVHRL